MKIIDVTKEFEKNFIRHKRTVVFHWTAIGTAKEAMDYLKKRLNGKGTVGYNYIIEKNGDVYMLANPCYAWMHNSAMGTDFDKNTISISFVNTGSEDFTQEQIISAKQLLHHIKTNFDVTDITNHHKLYEKKSDFPDDVWEELLKKID